MSLPPLPQRVSHDAIRRAVQESPAPELSATVRAALPSVSEPVKDELQRLASYLARWIESDDQGGPS